MKEIRVFKVQEDNKITSHRCFILIDPFFSELLYIVENDNGHRSILFNQKEFNEGFWFTNLPDAKQFMFENKIK